MHPSSAASSHVRQQQNAQEGLTSWAHSNKQADYVAQQQSLSARTTFFHPDFTVGSGI
jgi:hypothetical protein